MTIEADLTHRRSRRWEVAGDDLALWCMQLSLGFLFVVLFQPAPSDLFFALGFGILLWTKKISLAASLRPFFFALLVFFLANVISALAWKSASFGTEYLAITVYMLLIPLVMAHFAAQRGGQVVDGFYKSFFVAATISAVIGTLAVLHLAPGPLTLYFRSDEGIRLSPLFKDPNVFGPFMAMAGTLMIGFSMRASSRRRARSLMRALFILFAMFLTFSRGAWLGTGVSAAVFFALMATFARTRSTFIAFSLFSTIGSIFTLIAGALLLSRLNLTGFLDRRFGLQSYDTQRFANWRNALDVIERQPFGVGPGHYVGRTHFPESDFGLATHNLYLKIAVENGWLGFIAFFAAIMFLLVQLLRSIRNTDDRQPLRIAVIAAILGQFANSVVVDSLHWRHLFVLIGFACCELVVFYANRKDARTAPEDGTATAEG